MIELIMAKSVVAERHGNIDSMENHLKENVLKLETV
jgi:hypothetical protein